MPSGEYKIVVLFYPLQTTVLSLKLNLTKVGATNPTNPNPTHIRYYSCLHFR